MVENTIKFVHERIYLHSILWSPVVDKSSPIERHVKLSPPFQVCLHGFCLSPFYGNGALTYWCNFQFKHDALDVFYEIFSKIHSSKIWLKVHQNGFNSVPHLQIHSMIIFSSTVVACLHKYRLDFVLINQILIFTSTCLVLNRCSLQEIRCVDITSKSSFVLLCKLIQKYISYLKYICYEVSKLNTQ